MSTPALITGEDGHARCWWGASTRDYAEYHDREWGRPVTGDRAIYERLTLEAFQSGLSWLTILRKREGFRSAFAGFDPKRVAVFGDADVERLMNDAAIVRNRMKIDAAIANALALCAMQERGESLSDLVWSYRVPEAAGSAPRALGDLPVGFTPESKKLAAELKRRGFRFVGPTTVYSTLEACGIVNDHLAGCWVRDEVESERNAIWRE
ncbi:MAG: DNA-3-methyladenine glycosylase [Gaiellales bacterium]|nr:DNA-3-methyladenine glycosylase [Gaiellales bacterium]